jgi:hypothetical protein
MNAYESQMTVESMNAVPEGKQAYTLSNAAVATMLSVLHSEVERINYTLSERPGMSEQEYSMFLHYINRAEDAITQLSIQIDTASQG